MSGNVKVLRDRVATDVRYCVWDKSLIFSNERLELCWDFTVTVSDVMEMVSVKNSELFGYVPEFYLESVVDGFHTLRRLSVGTSMFDMFSDSRKDQLVVMLNFLSGHLSDKRVVSPDMKDMLLQSISVILQYEELIKSMEHKAFDKENLIRNLLTSFDQNMWIPVTNVILRFWRVEFSSKFPNLFFIGQRLLSYTNDHQQKIHRNSV